MVNTRFAGLFAALAGLLLMAGCGGGGFQTPVGPPPPPPPPPPTAASVAVISSSSSLPADANTADSPDAVTITAIAKDANNNTIPNVTVAFSATSGALAIISAITDSNGQATAKLHTGGDPTLRTITITATSGAASGSTLVQVVNPTQNATPASVTLLLSSSQLSSSASQQANGVTLTAVVKDASNNIIVGQTVSFDATSGTLVPIGDPPGQTDASGGARAVLTTGGDPTNRAITVTARAGTLSQQAVIQVVGTTLRVVGPSSLGRGDVGDYVITLADSSGTGIANQAVQVSSQAGSTLSATSLTTNVSGQATVRVTASSTATTDVISASALGLTAQSGTITISQNQFRFLSPAPPPAAVVEVALNSPQTIVVELLSSGAPVVGTTVAFSSTRGTLTCISGCVTDAAGRARASITAATAGLATIQATAGTLIAQSELEFVSTNPTRLDLQASPAVISTNSQSEITAIVRDPNDNLVKNQRVQFTLTDQTGGSLSVAEAITDSQGLAKTIYRSSSTASSSNGVIIDATIRDSSGTVLDTAQTLLTVGSQALRIVLGTGNEISEPTSTTYKLPYVAIVSDAAGNPAPSASFTLSVRSVSYRKGEFFKPVGWEITPTRPDTGGPNGITCPNEDVDFNGINEGEDTDGDGVLDPGNVATAPVTVPLDPDGTAQFDITYPQDRAYWVKVQLIARARVAGTETTETAIFDLPGLASDYSVNSPAPPGQVSPYGVVQDCTNPN